MYMMHIIDIYPVSFKCLFSFFRHTCKFYLFEDFVCIFREYCALGNSLRVFSSEAWSVICDSCSVTVTGFGF